MSESQSDALTNFATTTICWAADSLLSGAERSTVRDGSDFSYLSGEVLRFAQDDGHFALDDVRFARDDELLRRPEAAFFVSKFYRPFVSPNDTVVRSTQGHEELVAVGYGIVKEE